jgi:adenosylcobinamide amidohydrolase
VIAVALDRPWLVATLPRRMRVLSWAPVNPGFVTTRRILWREVRNADLTPGFDAEAWLAAAMAARGDGAAVGMMTSRDIGGWRAAGAVAGSTAAHAVATVGLSNAEAVGTRRPWHAAEGPGSLGTINVAVALGAGLTEAAQVEAMTVAAAARTAAVLAAGIRLPTGLATGTGTDCIALACDSGAGRHAGLHTEAGEAVGAAVRAAVADGVADWLAWAADKRQDGG